MISLLLHAELLRGRQDGSAFRNLGSRHGQTRSELSRFMINELSRFTSQDFVSSGAEYEILSIFAGFKDPKMNKFLVFA
jgi:hypothetical protein